MNKVLVYLNKLLAFLAKLSTKNKTQKNANIINTGSATLVNLRSFTATPISQATKDIATTKPSRLLAL
ncbi:MAG: hypothetical protein BJBARM5_0960 [Candidatus Parvarchaeum acidophilus ARMAN-5]|jgi:hypothetical protein|uniref:Uncharacterized protein n=1 Tax=Candidatus Parvarchaeum acidophilus ARMAN-5 TaxID=662762 RepID=D6GWT3_PARA5|nr:MAG: hypothetical protein BJBARM5_0960 [Candidatus Parvarchaeum acidophilus ARMAN-5]